MKAFVCHYSKLTERRRYLEQKLPEVGFNEIEWVTENDIKSYDLETVYDLSSNALSLRNKSQFSIYGITEQRPLRRPEIELTLQHFEAYRRIAEQKN